jgi:hypothetical protein
LKELWPEHRAAFRSDIAEPDWRTFVDTLYIGPISLERESQNVGAALFDKPLANAKTGVELLSTF